MTDWNDPKSPISTHFTVHEATWLPSWGIYHTPSDQEKAAILKTAATMDKIRDLRGNPISVHCWIRPTSVNCPGSPHHGQNYNAFVGSVAMHSAHIAGLAVDWDDGTDCDAVRAALLPLLGTLNIRMENLKGPWVHIDLFPVTSESHRFFIP